MCAAGFFVIGVGVGVGVGEEEADGVGAVAAAIGVAVAVAVAGGFALIAGTTNKMKTMIPIAAPAIIAASRPARAARLPPRVREKLATVAQIPGCAGGTGTADTLSGAASTPCARSM